MTHIKPNQKPLGWNRAFDDPIPLPDGRQLLTLREAANYLTKLQKAEQKLKELQTAAEVLLMAAEKRGPIMRARIGMLRGIDPQGRAGVQSVAQGNALGQAEAEAGRVISSKCEF